MYSLLQRWEVFDEELEQQANHYQPLASTKDRKDMYFVVGKILQETTIPLEVLYIEGLNIGDEPYLPVAKWLQSELEKALSKPSAIKIPQ